MVAGRHEQVGRPFHLLAEAVEHRSGRLSHAIMSVALGSKETIRISATVPALPETDQR